MSVGVTTPVPQTADAPPLRRLCSENLAGSIPRARSAAFYFLVTYGSVRGTPPGCENKGWRGATVGARIIMFLRVRTGHKWRPVMVGKKTEVASWYLCNVLVHLTLTLTPPCANVTSSRANWRVGSNVLIDEGAILDWVHVYRVECS